MRQRAGIIQNIVCDFDILLLQETHLKEDEEIVCPGYSAIRPRWDER